MCIDATHGRQLCNFTQEGEKLTGCTCTYRRTGDGVHTKIVLINHADGEKTHIAI